MLLARRNEGKMKVIIMAGGKGTRIQSITSDIPKPMLKINKMPVLEHEIRNLASQGFTEIIITVSYLGQVIMDYFKDGSSYGVQISYFVEEQPLGNAGALFLLRDQLDSDFLLLNADVIFDVDFQRFAAYHKAKGGLATIFTHQNSHPYDSGLVIADKNGTVEQWLTKEEERPQYYKNRVNAGLHILTPAALDLAKDKIEGGEKVFKADLDRQILRPLAGTGKLFCYDSPEYIKDMGTPERFYMVERYFLTGIVQAQNLSKQQKAIFLDRDGTINVYKGFLKNIKDFELIRGVADAIRKINESGYLAIVVTNQPVVARGELSLLELEEIHNRMETELGIAGAYLDSIYFCPHHPDKGYSGEVPEFKIECDCRKPKPGMLFQAAKDFNINLLDSWIIGDGENDIKAGKAAGCKTVLVGNGKYNQDITVDSVKEFVENWICRK